MFSTSTGAQGHEGHEGDAFGGFDSFSSFPLMIADSMPLQNQQYIPDHSLDGTFIRQASNGVTMDGQNLLDQYAIPLDVSSTLPPSRQFIPRYNNFEGEYNHPRWSPPQSQYVTLPQQGQAIAQNSPQTSLDHVNPCVPSARSENPSYSLQRLLNDPPPRDGSDSGEARFKSPRHEFDM